MIRFTECCIARGCVAPEGAQNGARERARRASFFVSRAAVAVCVLCAAPVWLFFNGAPNRQQLAIFALAQAPLIAAAVLARTGALRLAQYVSALGWLALAIGVGLAAQDADALTLALLATAVVEAALAVDTLLLAVVLVFGVVALAASVGFGAPPLAPAAAVAVAALFVYGAAISREALRAERARAGSEARNARDLRLLTDAIGDIVLHLDRSGAVASLVGDVHTSYGLETRDLLGRGFFQRVHVADRPAFLKLVSDAVDASGSIGAVLRLQVGVVSNPATRGIEPVFHSFDARTCRVGADGQRGGEQGPQVVCILRDVTEARRAEEELASARRETEFAAAAKSRFLANISHELRTPLSAIIGFADILNNEQLEPRDPAKRREYAQIISDSGHHLLELVNAILDVSKIESGAMQLYPESFSLPELVDQCVGMMQLKADQGGLTLLRDYRGAGAEVVADRRACKQILINLLSNAVKFTPAPGRVRIDIRPEGNSFAVSVADDGIGIAAADLDRLGSPFFQASASHDRAYEGAGLGLSLVRGLVGLHGGSMTIESAPHSGTQVTVRIPLDCRTQAERAAGPARIETIVRHGAVAFRPDRGLEHDMVKKIA